MVKLNAGIHNSDDHASAVGISQKTHRIGDLLGGFIVGGRTRGRRQIHQRIRVGGRSGKAERPDAELVGTGISSGAWLISEDGTAKAGVERCVGWYGQRDRRESRTGKNYFANQTHLKNPFYIAGEPNEAALTFSYDLL